LPCNGIGSQEVVRTIANEANPWRTTEISKVSNLLLVVLSQSGQGWFYLASLLMLILFVILYQSFVKGN
jgi:hypothetical protein